MGEDEVDRIAKSIKSIKGNDQLFAAVLLYTGMRKGEILSLIWDDIDFAKGFIKVVNAISHKNNQPLIQFPKSKNGIREIPIIEALLPYLEKYKWKGYLVGNGVKPLSRTQYTHTYDRMSKALQLKGITAHIFRHTFLTMLNNAGVEPKLLQTIAGHASADFTMRQYVHSQSAQLNRAGELLSEVYKSA